MNLIPEDFPKVTVIQAAALSDNLQLLQYFIFSGAHLTAPSLGALVSTTPEAAVGRRDMGVARMLLDKGAQVNASGGTYGSHLLKDAFGRHDLDMTRRIVTTGLAALQLAVGDNDKAMIHLLPNHGADIELKNIYGKTALLTAIDCQNPTIFSFILGLGAHPSLEEFEIALFEKGEDLFALQAVVEPNKKPGTTFTAS